MLLLLTAGTAYGYSISNVYQGGTGVSSFTSNSLLYSNSTGNALAFTSTSTLSIGGTAVATSDSTWTLHNSYPATCTNQFVRAIGDTNTCASVAYTDMSAMTSANFAGLISNETGTNLLVFNTSPTFQTNILVQNSTTNIGLGTTTPWGYLSVGNHNGGTEPIFVVASSSSAVATTTHFIINQFGNVGVGTTTPSNKFSVQGDSYFSGQTFFGATTTSTSTGGYLGVISSMKNLSFQSGTTTAWTATTSGAYIAKAVAPFTGTIRNAYCSTDVGTLGVDIYHTSTHLNYIPTASTTANLFTFTTNNTFTRGEVIYLSAGTPASSPTSLTCTLGITETP